METVGHDLATSRQVAVTAGNSNAKGAWGQVVAATSFPWAGMILQLGHTATVNRFAIDVGFGAAASEYIILPDYYVAENAAQQHHQLFLPMAVPAGTRIAARGMTNATTGTNTFRVQAVGIAANPRLPSPQMGRATALGFTAATTVGATVDPGATINTKGAWVELSAATPHDISWVLFGFGHEAVMTVNGSYLLDVAIGAAAAETIVHANHYVLVSSARQVGTSNWWLPLQIPAGSRVAVRAQCSLATATERLLSVVMYGVS